MRRPLARTLLQSAAPWLRDSLWRRASAVPSLDLRFAENKSLNDAVSGQNLITFTRASSATFVNSQGLIQAAAANEPRFDHSPLTGESLGLPVEEARTNLLLRSEEFDNAAWNSSAGARSVTADAIASPSGTTTADRITADGTNVPHFVSQTVTVTNAAHACSVFTKAGTSSTLVIRAFSALGGANVFFNLSNGTVGSTALGGVGSIVAYPNGWHRCVMTFTPLAATGGLGLYIDDIAANTATGTLHLWGAQLELGAFPTSYIPTTSATVTRSADMADIINTAIANGIRTFYAEFRSPASATRGVVSLNDNSANERAAINSSGTDPRLVVVDGGVTQADIDAGTIVANARSRMAVRISADNFAASFNGEAVVSDTSGSLPTVDRLFIGRSQAGEYLNAPIARLVGWREALPNIALQELTR